MEDPSSQNLLLQFVATICFIVYLDGIKCLFLSHRNGHGFS